MSYCLCCGKTLTDPLSIALRMGPVCRMRQKEVEMRNGNLFGNLADYSVTVVDGVICLVDNDNGASVTNTAEAVIADLAAKGYDLSLPVIYRDTMGVWDRLLVSGGRFAGFAPVHERDQGEAVAKVKVALAGGQTIRK